MDSDPSPPPAPVHPLILRERALWDRYQDMSKRKGDTAIANCFYPFFWGVIVTKVDNEATGNTHLGTIDRVSHVLDAIEKGLDHVEKVYPDALSGRGLDR